MSSLESLLSNREEYTENGHEVVRHEIDALLGNELNGIVFNLPRPAGSMNDPYLAVYGREDLGGFFFSDQKAIYDEVVFGLAGPRETEKLESAHTPTEELSPFIHHEAYPPYGIREYGIPLEDERSFEVRADVRENREDESVIVRALEDDELVSALTIGRRDGGWTYISRDR